ncbi:FtsW/RodA/SpoVE family cell cycle protein [bacterium]|nr:FtsW/RodA/SpoVE family cell cycle protein [candidate division CSSED10-310 bacterium]
MLTVFRLVDPWILITLIAMLGLGLAAVLTASVSLNPNPFFYFFRQLLYVVIGIGMLLISACIDYRTYRFKTQYPFILAIVLLMAVYMFGNQSWLTLIGGFHIQPSEIAKIIIIVYLSYVMSFDRHGGYRFWRHSLPIMTTCGFLIVMTALQPDFGTALVMAFITVYLLFIGSMPLRHLMIPFVCVLPMICVVPFVFSHVHQRIDYFLLNWQMGLKPWQLGYHDYQMRLAMGSGGWFGKGFGNGIIKRSFLPASHTDSIFSVLVEEGGLVTGMAVVLLFLALFLLGERTARLMHDRFGAMLARGITFYVAIQGFLNIGVCLGIFPNTGVTLPLFSYGGSSMIVTLFTLGIFLNVSSQRRIVY